MDINNIVFPNFSESWNEYRSRCPKNSPYHFVIVGNAILTQYVDGYLYPVPFGYKEGELYYKDTVHDKVRYLKSMMEIYSNGNISDVNSRMAENYPPYCTLFAVPDNNKDLLSIIIRINDIRCTEMTAVGYCRDYDCYIGEIRIPYGHGEDSGIYLLSKETGEAIKMEKDFKKTKELIHDSGIFVGTSLDINCDDGRLCQGIKIRTIDTDKPYQTSACVYFDKNT